MDSEKIGRLISRQNLKLWVIVAIAAFTLISIISFIASNAVISVTYEAAAVDKAKPRLVAYDSATLQDIPVMQILGLTFVPRSADSIKVASGEAETTMRLGDVPRFSIKDVKIKLEPLFTLKEAGSGGLDCPLLGPSGTYSYACNLPSFFVRHEQSADGDSKNSKVGSFPSDYNAARYRDGIITVSRTTPDSDDLTMSAFYAAPGKDRAAAIQLPSGLRFENNLIEIAADAHNPDNKGFVVQEYNTGNAWYYPDFSNSAEPIPFKRQTSLNLNTDTANCKLLGKKFACYIGNRDVATHGEEEAREADREHQEPRLGRLEVTDFSAAQPTSKIYSSEGAFGINELLFTGEGNLFAKGSYKLYEITLQNTTYTASPVTENASLASGGTSLYYVQDNKLYEYDHETQSSLLRYKDKKVTISSIHSFDGKSAIILYRLNDPAQITRMYQLQESR